MTLALLLSLLFHGLLFSLTYGGQGTGLPGLGLPWQDRRAEVPVLQVVLAPAPAAVEQPMAEGPVLAPPISVDTPPGWSAATVLPPAQRPDDVLAAAARFTAPPADPPVENAPAAVRQPILNPLTRSDPGSWTVPVTPAPPAPAFVTAPSASSPAAAAPLRLDAVEAAPVRTEPEVRDRADETAQAELLEAARQETARQDATLAEAGRLDTERQEAARQAAARQEIARQEAARQEAARGEAARQEAARQEAVRQDAARQEAARVEAVRQEAARQGAARQDAARAEATRLEAGRQDAARQAAAGQEAARIEQAQEAEARREATLRAIGRQLDEEAARRDAASATARQSLASGPSSSSVRRGRLFGRADSNAALVLYAEGWSRKIQLNQTFEMVREAAKQAHVDPIVTVAVRSDGSIESVSFVRSSGVAALDDAIRRVVQSQLPYQAFPPPLAAEYDVVEIRRTWVFDMAIRLH